MSARLLMCMFRLPVWTAPGGVRPLCDWLGMPHVAQAVGSDQCSMDAMLNRFLPASLTIRYVV